ADGLMVGRGAIRDPWVFAKIRAALEGRPPVVVDDAERERVLIAFYETIRERFSSDLGALGRMKKIARYFSDGIEGGEGLRTLILHSETVDQAFGRIREFFAVRRAA